MRGVSLKLGVHQLEVLPMGILGIGMGHIHGCLLGRDSLISGLITAEMFVLHSVSIVQKSFEKLPQKLLLCSKLITEQVRRNRGWGVGGRQPPMQVMHGLSCGTPELASPNTRPENIVAPTPWNYLGTQGWTLRSGWRAAFLCLSV